MEFLFTDKGAFIEAIIVLLCLLVVLIIGLYDGYNFLRKFFGVFQKHAPNETPAVETPKIDGTITAENKSIEDLSTIPNESVDTISTHTEESVVVDDPDAIYDEYVALVEETHREKEEEQAEETLSDKTTEAKVDEVLGKNDIPSELPKTIEVEPEASIEDTQYTETIDGETTQSENEVTLEPTEISSSVDEVEKMEDVGHAPSEKLPEEVLESKGTPDIAPDDAVVPEVIETTPITDEPVNVQTGEEDSSPDMTSSVEEIPAEKTTTNEEGVKEKSQNETIFAIVNAVKTLIARKETTEARTLIIQGLAIDKHHRDLNILLGSLYETERQFEKAEYVYKDLAMEYPNNIEILEKLGNVLIIEKRYSIALEIYKKILDIGGETEGTLYILSHLCHEIGDANEGHIYMKKYLKQWPNNPEVLSLMGNAEIELGKRKDAIETLKRLKNLTPYNGEITATLQKLMMEEELAGNFGEDK